MENYIAPLLLLIVLFVGFGLAQRGKQHSGGCGSCTGASCSGKSECSNRDKPGHQ
jgi:hypothetical protein